MAVDNHRDNPLDVTGRFWLRDHVQISPQTGKGAYGKVFDVKYAGATYSAQAFQENRGDIERIKQHFVEVCRNWSTVCHHSNIALFIDVYYESDHTLPLIVTEKMPYTLRSIIKGEIKNALMTALPQKLSILCDISSGLWYLHDFQQLPIVHCGLIPDNILVGYSQYQPQRLQAKITNVGVFKVVKVTGSEQDTVTYLAPEVRSENPHYNPSCDVYSFGKLFLATTGANILESTRCEFSDRQLQEYSEDTDLVRLISSCSNSKEKRPKISRISEAMLQVTEKSAVLNEEAKQKPNTRKVYCFHPGDTVDIALGESGIAAEPPITIPEFYKQTFDIVPNEKALCWKNNKDDPWESMTYADYKKLIYSVAKSFVKLELKPSHAVGILGFNSVEWFASSIGAVFAGGLSVGVCTADICEYILKDCKANIVVVENAKLLNTIKKIHDKLPHLKAIVQYKGELSENYPDTYTWEKFLKLGKDMEDSVIDGRIDEQRPNQCAIVLYTSGTTGNPKGVMLSHDNFTWGAVAFLDTVGSEATKRIISYLPSVHMIGTFTDMFLPISVGGTVWFANMNAVEGSLISTMKEVQPTFLFSTPRVWEKVKEKEQAKLSDCPDSSLTEIKSKLGLDKCKHLSVGAGPVHEETHKYFRERELILLGHFGMSESTLPLTTNLLNAEKFGSCGRSTNGVQVGVLINDEYNDSKVLHFKEKNNNTGEVICRGRNVFMGYLGNEEKTRETIDDEGWLHSGDIGWLDKDSYLHILCRIDDLVEMAGGYKIVPIEIEEWIKSEIEFLSNVILIGNKREYLTCLLTLKCVVDPDTGEATDGLQPQVIKIFKEDLGTDCTTVSQVIETKDKAVFRAIQDGINHYNESRTFSDIQKIRNWRLLPDDFTVTSGELGPILKLRRSLIEEKRSKEIKKMYGKTGKWYQVSCDGGIEYCQPNCDCGIQF